MARAGAGNYYFVENSVQLAGHLPDRASGIDGDHGPPCRADRPPGSGSRGHRRSSPSWSEARPARSSSRTWSATCRSRSCSGLSVAARAAQVRALPLPSGLGSRPARRPRSARSSKSAWPCRPFRSAEWEKLPLDPAVQEQLALVMATRARDEYHAASPARRRSPRPRRSSIASGR